MRENLTYSDPGRVPLKVLLKAGMERTTAQEIALNRLDPLLRCFEFCLSTHLRPEIAEKKYYCIMGSEARKNSRLWLNVLFLATAGHASLSYFLICPAVKAECLFRVTFFGVLEM